MTANILYRRLAHRATCSVVVGLLLCALAVALGGVPVRSVVRKDRSTPFPCQDRACGCLNADACWKHCCCFTNSQKLAWAKEQGVTPPIYVAEAARQEAHPPPRSCCAAKGSCEAPAAANKTSTPGAASSTAEAASDAPLVLISEFRQCQGLGALWVLLGQAWISPAETWAAPRPLAGEWLTIVSERSLVFSFTPEAPPPNSARV